MANEGVVNLGSGIIRDTHISAAAAIQQSKLALRSLTNFPQDALNWREWDTLSSLLPATATGTYLGLVTGATFGTNPPQVQTGDLHAVGLTTRRARQIVRLPDNFVAGGNAVLRAIAGMSGHAADTSATILVEAYQLNDDGTLSAQLATAPASVNINSLTLANFDFTLTTTNLAPGSRLDVRVSLAVTDAAGASAVIGVLHSLILRCDVQP